MTTSSIITPDADRLLADALHRVWGFSGFRPLQREAMHAILAARDSVVVLPTGGGKSLCFQAPAIVARGSLDVLNGPAEAGRYVREGEPAGGPETSVVPETSVMSGFSRTNVAGSSRTNSDRIGLAVVVSPLISPV